MTGQFHNTSFFKSAFNIRIVWVFAGSYSSLLVRTWWIIFAPIRTTCRHRRNVGACLTNVRGLRTMTNRTTSILLIYNGVFNTIILSNCIIARKLLYLKHPLNKIRKATKKAQQLYFGIYRACFKRILL